MKVWNEQASKTKQARGEAGGAQAGIQVSGQLLSLCHSVGG